MHFASQYGVKPAILLTIESWALIGVSGAAGVVGVGVGVGAIGVVGAVGPIGAVEAKGVVGAINAIGAIYVRKPEKRNSFYSAIRNDNEFDYLIVSAVSTPVTLLEGYLSK